MSPLRSARRPIAALSVVAALVATGLTWQMAGATPRASAAAPPNPRATAHSAANPPAARVSEPDIERQVMCPVCGVPLNLTDSPQAQREKVFIRGLIARGDGAAQIKRALVVQYGSGVLALPPASGFDLTVYLVPAIVVGGVALALAIALPRWRRRSLASAVAVPSLSAAETARVDAELSRFD